MMITRQSMFTGNVHSIDIDVTEEQLAAWQNGQLIQRAMPNLEPWEREFIKTGVTEEEWNETFC